MKISTPTADPAKTNPASDPTLLRAKSKQDFNSLMGEFTEGAEDQLLAKDAEATSDGAGVLTTDAAIAPKQQAAEIVIERLVPLDTDDLSLGEEDPDEELTALEDELVAAANQLTDAFAPTNTNALPEEAIEMEGLSGNLAFQPMASGDEVTFSIDSGLFAGVQVHVSHDQTTGEVAVRFITAANTIPGISQNLHRIARSLRRNGLRVKELRIEQRASAAAEDEGTPDVQKLFRSQK